MDSSSTPPPTVQIETSWKNRLIHQFNEPYFAQLVAFLKQEKAQGQVVYPPGPLIFNAFALTPFANAKVLLLGQDPYHGAGQAHGLCFSVPAGIKPPPSLVNVFKELQTDLGPAFTQPAGGNLEPWARQGVLLLNATLTVRVGQPGSHQNKGWETFTDAVIKTLSDEKEHMVFLLWGRYAGAKAALIDARKHLVLQAAHPSPYSADKGFFGCHHFSKTNQYLQQHGLPPIDWRLG
jgi:uracil-DNA glycosylase